MCSFLPTLIGHTDWRVSAAVAFVRRVSCSLFHICYAAGILIMGVACIFFFWQYYYTEADKHLWLKSGVADSNSMSVVFLKYTSLLVPIASFVFPTSIWQLN
jgi:hypothetical protein